MSSESSSKLPVELASRNSKSSSSIFIVFLLALTSASNFARCSSSSGFSTPITTPSNWSSRPPIVTVKSMTVAFAESSGVKCGLGSLVVIAMLNASL